jgi:hypothetical protein
VRRASRWEHAWEGDGEPESLAKDVEWRGVDGKWDSDRMKMARLLDIVSMMFFYNEKHFRVTIGVALSMKNKKEKLEIED